MASAPRELDRPAFYALRAGGWRDLVTLLHPPYTAWHLSYVAIRPAGLLVAGACCLLSAAQRQLSTPVRRLRRSTTEVIGQQRLSDGTVIELTRAGLSAPLEGALRVLWLAVVLLAVGFVAVRA